ncbi:hypothetical protein MJO28_010616 [Puccinia striiformis f. sp. tritici]|uniref:NADP-dependent oxidoreductase domain-containing protein n=3 Tax=Puccinia striiformis TaxID=27350 RepID=A0A0L0V976_9BASI|nr:hypothetical protein Pst134EA_019438 [Puccinia striiformis f. sp. tritici]KNE95842.1 hypothetical protein PSTG_10902 [Puccinia striiformis f. sp. tritici PST-78]POV99172.1 hypothetical protein PSHT_13654 [Puccinia striiformis]KAH9449501.1 hypothetical protein Pst134EB_020329 [Puccinia striiformis f. sp. tritici]KAH9459283.1 hypothetical protein Pst134EA_019438 [Puccinia striiformis f. sp. tritici]KAI7944921.1 hypothetical protein MJO28_010616 [Puccinia striiformis f. sp. tritici]
MFPVSAQTSAINPSMAFSVPLTMGSHVTLNSGHQMPILGFGTSYLPNAEEACNEAIKIGYRHLDSARTYHTEVVVANAAAKCENGRDSVFLTTKIPVCEFGKAECKKALEDSLYSPSAPKPEYWDLVLLHEPLGGPEARHQAYEALAEAQKEGKVRSIGVSNFGVHHLEALRKANVGPVPAVNQLEVHPWAQQKSTVEYCKSHGIIVQAYCPLTRGKHMSDEKLLKISEKVNKTPAQVLLRWSLQKGFVPLPKSHKPKNIKENANIFDFELTDEDMSELDSLDQGDSGFIVKSSKLVGLD